MAVRKLLSLLLVIAFLPGYSFGQETQKFQKDTVLGSRIIGLDTLPHIELKEITILPIPTFNNRRDARQYWRLVYNLKKVLPLSKIVAAVVTDVEWELSAINSDKARRKYIRKMEDSLWNQYEKDLRKMTTTQGQLLFKLVSRETVKSTYQWIDYYRGSVSAFFWQGIARLFGSNLKADFDPANRAEDRLIEELIGYIEKGWI